MRAEVALIALVWPGSDVVELTDANFHREVTASDDMWMVEFYAPWYAVQQPPLPELLMPEQRSHITQTCGNIQQGMLPSDVPL